MNDEEKKKREKEKKRKKKRKKRRKEREGRKKRRERVFTCFEIVENHCDTAEASRPKGANVSAARKTSSIKKKIFHLS